MHLQDACCTTCTHAGPPPTAPAAHSHAGHGVQAETADLEHQISACRQRLTASHSKQTELQRRRIALSTRHTDAAVSLTALTSSATCATSAPAAPPPQTSCSGLSSSTTAAALRASLGHTDASPHTSAAPAPSAATAPSHTHANSTCTAVVPVMPRQHRTFYNPPGRNPWTEAPRPIGSFRHCAGISYADLHAVAEGSSDLIDLRRQSVVSLIEKATLRKAQQMGVSGTGVPGDDICWFAEMPYEAAPGVPLSTSATIGSPECVATLAVHWILTQLELALITAATDCMGREASEVIPSVTEVKPPPSGTATAPPPTTPPTPPPACRTRTAATTARALPNLPRKRSQRRPSSRPQEDPSKTHDPCSTESDSTVARDGAEEGQLATEASAGPTRSGTWRWSGCVRCGVNETHDGRAAMRSIVRGTVRRFCGLIPSQTILKILHGYLLGLVRMLGTVGPQSAAQEMEPHSSGGIVEFVSKATIAAQGAAQMLWTEIADVASMRVLQQLVRLHPI